MLFNNANTVEESIKNAAFCSPASFFLLFLSLLSLLDCASCLNAITRSGCVVPARKLVSGSALRHLRTS